MDQEHKRLELVSRIVIFIPIVVVILAYVIQQNKPSTATLSQQITPTISAQETIGKKTQSKSSSSIKLNLTGPYKCQYVNSATSVDASIKNKKIAVNYISNGKNTHMLINGDCGYMWEDGKTNGEKMCNIGQYLSMAEMLSSMNLMSLDSVFSMISQVDPSIKLDSSTMSAVAGSCKKQEVADTLFTVPTNIVFSDMQTISPTVAPLQP